MRKRKRTKQKMAHAIGRKMEEITLYHQRIPREQFYALSKEEKYSFLLLGHVHDEISWLQRMAYAASRQNSGDSDVEISASMMQATFMARLFLGKLFEFYIVLEKSRPLQEFIRVYFQPDDLSIGEAKVKEMLFLFEENSWIRTARNKYFLHYPSQGDVADLLSNENIEWQIDIYHGRHSSNTFYPASDFLANFSWLRLVNSEDPIQGLEDALDKLQEIAKIALQILEQSVGYFIDSKLMKLSENEAINLKVNQTMEDTRLYYFLKM